jgi:hypothetical protein
MARKSPKDLDTDIDAYLRGERAGPREVHPLPRYSAKKGGWTGGDKHTLYRYDGGGNSEVAWWRVVPGQGTVGVISHGPGTRVRVATKAEAEEKWQNPLHAGWTVTA